MIRRSLTLVLIVVTMAACSRQRDTAAPMATPSVSLSHTRIPLGGPIEIVYRFQVAPNARFSKNYRVLVHFLDADDELMWTDDHLPPTPTSQWKPGQTIEYRRTMFIPLYPYIGDATISVGLYAPDTQERVPMTGDHLGQREYRVAHVRLQPQTDTVFVAFLDGWHPPENAADNQSVEWQWTRKEATLRFRNPKRNATFYLDYDARPEVFETPQTATIAVGNNVVDTFQITSSEQTIRKIPIKAEQFGDQEMVILRISVDKTFVPARIKPGSRDSRELGIRVFHVFVEPQ